MPVDEDKYPTETGRRRFVKGVVGSAGLASVAAGGAASLNAATNPSGIGGGTLEYIAIALEDGPAPRGMPVIPIEIRNGNEIHGLWPETQEVQQGARTVTVARQEVGGIQYDSAWFQYCGVQNYPSVQPGFEAETAVAAGSGYDWMQDVESGATLTLDMFDDYEEWGNGIGNAGLGKPASGTWRENDQGRPLPVQVLRTPELPKMINGEGKYSSLSGEVRNFLEAATAENVMMWLNKCTHFCCTPQGFKTSTYQGASDRSYCQCHQSIYNPFNPLKTQFVSLPRPADGAGGDGE
ncbi:ubiquinol-cytochrome c reductase iron-sulfur subunit [Halobacteriales archaeon Cl-PHB]